MSAPTNNDGLDDDLALEPTTYARGGIIHGFGDPMTLAMLEESTSATLRRVEQERDEAKRAFAASQADLTRVGQELDGARARCMRLGDIALERRRERYNALVALDLARAELATARAELELLRKNEEIRARVIRELRAELRNREGETHA